MYPVPAIVYFVDYSSAPFRIIELWEATSRKVLAWDYSFYCLARTWE
jgi:hypothetical protein